MSFTIRNCLLAKIERGGSYQSKNQHLKKRIISWEKDNLLEKASINDSMSEICMGEVPFAKRCHRGVYSCIQST